MATPLTRSTRRGIVALALVLGVCGSGGDRTGTGVGAATSSSSSADTSGAVPRATDGAGQPVTTLKRGQPSTTTHAATPTTASATISRAAVRAPGQFAGVLLAPGAARTVVLDLRVQPGASVGTDVAARLAQILRDQSGKSVVVDGPTPLKDSAQVHTADDIRRLADTQGEPDGADVAVLHLLYLAGRSDQDGVLGVTVRADTIAVFPDEIASATSPLVGATRIERAVVVHELGHVLGLVDLFLNDHREDPDHPGHSTNRNSVMYWAVESDVVAQLFGGPPPVDFDSADLADLRSIHAGAASQD